MATCSVCVIKELDTERADVRTFTSWPLVFAAIKLFVFSEPSVLHDKGLKKLEHPPPPLIFDGAVPPLTARE